jgi:hypothetical protein
MSRPYCSNGEPWDKESNDISEAFDIKIDKENGDVIMFEYFGTDHCPMTETRMSKRGAIRLALTLMAGATGKDMGELWNYIQKEWL